MLKKLIISLFLALPAIGLAAHEVSSPDGNIKLTFALKDGHIPTYRLDYKGLPVVKESRMGFRLSDSGLYDWFEVADVQRGTIDETWTPVWGEESSIRNHCNEMTVTLRQSTTGSGSDTSSLTSRTLSISQ